MSETLPAVLANAELVDDDHPNLRRPRRSMVAVLVAFTPVQRHSPPTLSPAPPQVRTFLTTPEPPDEHLESVLGATPHEFESRILRSR
jgi:hypothetical protein